MVLKGDSSTGPKTLPVINPEFQNRSIISAVHDFHHSVALTSSGKFLTWSRDYDAALCLGDPGKFHVGSSGGYTREKQVQGQVYRPPNVRLPSEVRFDHGLKAGRRVERYCIAATAGSAYIVALVIDLAGSEVPPEDLEQHFETTVPREESNNPDRS